MYRVFPLPYHQQGFIVSKAAALVSYYTGDNNAVFTFMDTAFANQGNIYNSATADMTYNEVVAMVVVAWTMPLALARLSLPTNSLM